jgi:hypothetical protein
LEQGLSTIEATVTASEPLPAVVPLQPILLPIPTIRSPHQFILPKNTIGQARTRSKPHIQPPHTPQISQFQFIVPPSSYIIFPPSTTPIPKSTKSYRKEKSEETLAGESPRRYKERTTPAKCSKCGQNRTYEQ